MSVKIVHPAAYLVDGSVLRRPTLSMHTGYFMNIIYTFAELGNLCDDD